MFQSQVIGNLGADAAIQNGENDKKYVTFSVAHTEYSRDKEGHPVERTVWISVTWYSYTDKMLSCLKKGTKVFVSGRTKAKAYTDNSGNPQPGIGIYASEVVLCGLKNENTGEPVTHPYRSFLV